MLKHDFVRFLLEISSKLFFEWLDEETVNTPQTQLAEEIREAYREWITAQKYFQWVSDPDLVDYAIFTEEAARRKYIYLLNQAKNQGINAEELK